MRRMFFIDPRPANDNALALDEVEALASRATVAAQRASTVHWLRARRYLDGAHVLVLVRGGFARRNEPANDDAPTTPGAA